MAKLADVGSSATHFETLADPRHTRNRKHRFVDIAVIGSPNTWSCPTEFLRAIAFAACSSPSSPTPFSSAFKTGSPRLCPSDSGASRRPIAIDGKTCRGSHDDAHNSRAFRSYYPDEYYRHH